jgi:hypothetical protein
MGKVISSIINHTFHKYQNSILILDGDDRALQWIKTNNIHQIQFYKDKNFCDFKRNYIRNLKIHHQTY